MRLALRKNSYAPASFNPRICKRCDRHCKGTKFLFVCFNPRICKRCDQIGLIVGPSGSGFNPRICKRCDLSSPAPGSHRCSFNPRICKRCDEYQQGHLDDTRVSIHASVKDATRSCLVATIRLLRVSIHASVKDATPCL